MEARRQCTKNAIRAIKRQLEFILSGRVVELAQRLAQQRRYVHQRGDLICWVLVALNHALITNGTLPSYSHQSICAVGVQHLRKRRSYSLLDLQLRVHLRVC